MIVHLFALLVPALAAQIAGLTVGTIGLAVILGRSVLSRLLIWERLRLLSTLRFNSSVRAVFILAGGETILLLLRGVVLLGFGIGNGTSLPPLIAQVEFTKEDSARAAPAIIAIAQAISAIAPMTFGLMSCPSHACGALRSSSQPRRSCKAPAEKYRPQGRLPSPADAARMIEVTWNTPEWLPCKASYQFHQLHCRSRPNRSVKYNPAPLLHRLHCLVWAQIAYQRNRH